MNLCRRFNLLWKMSRASVTMSRRSSRSTTLRTESHELAERRTYIIRTRIFFNARPLFKIYLHYGTIWFRHISSLFSGKTILYLWKTTSRTAEYLFQLWNLHIVFLLGTGVAFSKSNRIDNMRIYVPFQTFCNLTCLSKNKTMQVQKP